VPTKQTIALSVVLVIAAAALGFVGYRLNQKPSPPPFPSQCLGELNGRCSQEQSGFYFYSDRANDPAALTVTYGNNIYGAAGTAVDISVGANVPAHQTLHWMIQLYGVSQLKPETFGPDSGSPRTRIWLGPGVTLQIIKTRTPNSGNTVQVLTGSIVGPVAGYTTLKSITEVPIGALDEGIQFISGDADGDVVNMNDAFTEGNLPYVIARNPNAAAGGIASAPNISFGQMLVPGTWYYPRTIWVQESYSMPVDSTLSYAQPSTSAVGVTSWESDSFTNGIFELTSNTSQSDQASHEFWAGIVLGIAGSALIGSVQTLSMIEIRRRRVTNQGQRQQRG
jgi:hypothetical protein